MALNPCNASSPSLAGYAIVDNLKGRDSFDNRMQRLYGYTLQPSAHNETRECYQWNTRGEQTVGLW